jgi:hypothetical protein
MKERAKTSKRFLGIHVNSQLVAESLKLRVLRRQIKWHQLASQLFPSFQSRTEWVVAPHSSIPFVGRPVAPQVVAASDILWAYQVRQIYHVAHPDPAREELPTTLLLELTSPAYRTVDRWSLDLYEGLN